MTDNIQEMYKKARIAFAEVEFWPQEKVDEMVAAVGWEWQKEENAQVLARTAVDESSIGVYEDKVAKIQSKTRGTLRDMVGAKTCGLVEEDRAKGLRKYAKPMGVIANVVPCTNPESTVCCLGLSTLKTRNAMIVTPHPRTQKSTHMTVELGRKALRKVGAPEDLLQCIKETSREKTRELMARCDFAVATGGAALVRVVYDIRRTGHAEPIRFSGRTTGHRPVHESRIGLRPGSESRPPALSIRKGMTGKMPILRSHT